MSRELIIQAVRALAGVCDGAQTLDGIGFNGADTALGHYLADLPDSEWTPKRVHAAWQMIGKYRGQLFRYGIDYAAIPEPVLPEPIRILEITPDKLIFRFDYDETIKDDLKATFANRKWDNERKQWEVRGVSLADAHTFADRHNFRIEGDETVYQHSSQPTLPERRIQLNGDTFHIHFPYDVQIKDELKELSVGAKWSKPYWTAPLRTADAPKLLAFAEKHVFFMDDITRNRLEFEAGKAAVNTVNSRAQNGTLKIEGLRGEASPYQLTAVEYALPNKRLFIADEQGLGKSLESLATVFSADAFPCLIVCEANMKLGWKREIEQWLPAGKFVYIVKGKTPERIKLDSFDFVIINYDIFSDWLDTLLSVKWRSVICDESTALKNGKAKRTIAAITLCTGLKEVKNSEGKRVQIKVGEPVEYRLFLTGTPALNRPFELVSQLQALSRLDEFGGWFRFCVRYTNATRTRFGWDFSGAANLNELNEKMRAGGMYIRRLKADVLQELPDKRRVILPQELDNRVEYDRAQSDVIAYLNAVKPIVIQPPAGLSLEGFQKLQWGYNAKETDNEKLGYLRSLSMAQNMDERHFALFAEQFESANAESRRAFGREHSEHLLRFEALKQLAAWGKMDAALQWISNFLETGEQLLFFAHHQDIIEHIAKTFNAPMIVGGVSTAKRQQIVDDFQAQRHPLVVANIRAGGKGITLHAASHVGFLELEWNMQLMKQAEDRLHRRNQKNAVTAWYLLAENSIDMEIWQLLQAKVAVTDAVTEGSEIDENDKSLMGELIERMRGK